MDSILNSVKMYLGISVDDTAFDSDIVIAINAIMVVLNQLGVGPATPFVVENASATWSEFLGEEDVGAIRQYLGMRVRLLFDPPTNTYVMQALKEQTDELEWRIIAEVDKKAYEAMSNE